MQTIASLAERLEMAAEYAVEVLRKLQFQIADVDTEIDDDAVDLLLDIDEDETVFEKKYAAIKKAEEKAREAERKKEAAEAKKKAAAAKRKAAAKKKAAPAKKKTAAPVKPQPEKEESGEESSAEAEKDEGREAQESEDVAEVLVKPEEAVEEAGEQRGVEVVDEAQTAEAPSVEAETPVVEVEAEILDVAEPASENIAEEETAEADPVAPKIPLAPHAEIIVDSEEDALAAAAKLQEKMESGEDDGAHARGKLAAAEQRHEAEERRRATREKERQQKKQEEKKGAIVSDVAPDPEVVAEVIRRDQERKRREQEKKERRKQGPPPAASRKSDRLATPLLETFDPVASAPPPIKEKGKADAGLSKTARKKVKRAERNRMREQNSLREAAAAVKEFQAGAVSGGVRKRRKKRREDQVTETSDQPMGGIIEVEEMVTVEVLANLMDMPVNDLILTLMDENISATKNQTLDMEVVRLVAGKLNFEVRVVIPEEEALFAKEEDDPASLKPRPPVVTVMGHVDHGKTSLLDVIRSTKVAEGEAGGITQHIAAYDIEIEQGRVTFLDTPGHQAFTQMRARGAHITDVVVLVVAANDGVKPQTIEAIDHAKAAEVPIVVAINKCDLDNAQPDRVRQELTQYGLVDDAWGGKVIMRNISAKMNQGVTELMEMLVLQSDMLELRANPDKRARGAIVESEIAVGLGPVAWVLVQDGTLRVGDTFLAGCTYGRVRSMTTCRGENVQEAGPSTPVAVTGFETPPDAGDIFIVTPDERVARNIAEQRAARSKLKRGPATRHMTLEDFHARFEGQEQKKLNVIIKSDVQGSVDVLRTSFAKMGNEEVSINVIHSGVGGINESDVVLAEASDAVIIGFHVTANSKVQKLAEQVGVDIRTYRIIYEALDQVRNALEGMLTPDKKEVVLGHAEVREVFSSSALGNIAGCYMTDGEAQRSASARLVRDGVIVYEGTIVSLRRMKDDVRSVATGYECGIKLDKFNDIHVGDVIEMFKIESVAKTLVQETS